MTVVSCSSIEDRRQLFGEVVFVEWCNSRPTHWIVWITDEHVVTRGDKNGEAPDYLNVTGTDREHDFVYTRGRRWSLPTRNDIVSVVSCVIYDGCGTLPSRGI